LNDLIYAEIINNDNNTNDIITDILYDFISGKLFPSFTNTNKLIGKTTIKNEAIKM